MFTRIWDIEEAPGYQIEETVHAWVLWGPCCEDTQCLHSKVIAMCSKNDDGSPSDVDMVARVTGLTSFTPIRNQ